MNPQILLIDDDIEIHTQIKLTLNNCDLFFSENLTEAWNILDDQNIDLIILDVTLPDGDGFSFFLELRNKKQFSAVPVIFLTSKDNSRDKVIGLSLGADDYVVKPFDRLELNARVALRLSNSKRKISDLFKKTDLEFEVLNQRLYLIKENKKIQINLTGFEFKLLLYLAEREDQVLSRRKLLEAIWDSNLNVVDRTVDVHISNLRKKMKNSIYTIRSVYGEGYQFTQNKNRP
jgi:DNA-binding response OmpR family regulator